MEKGRIFSINLSQVKGTSKIPVNNALAIEGHGLDNDAHAGQGLRQVSLLAIESIRKQRDCPKVKETIPPLEAGDFAENITTEGINLSDLKVGDKLNIGRDAVLEISKIGKECHNPCAIYYKLGDCIMPKQGVFAKVLKGGEVNVGDDIEISLTAKRQ